MNKTIIAAMVAIAPALAACGQSASQPQSAAPPPPQVTVAKPVSKMIADEDEYVGRFVAVESVEVRARVSGYLDAIHFQDGQIVKKGDLLFTIDRRPFEATLAQAQASLARARANLAFAESDLARAQNVAVGTVITQQTSTSACKLSAWRRRRLPRRKPP
jgi:RND family efflux transporter MFP subunit